MPGTAGPRLGLKWGWSPGDDGWGVDGFNPNFAKLEALVQLGVLSILDTPPVSPSDGDCYIVGLSPTGLWMSHENDIAVWIWVTTGSSDWVYLTPPAGASAWNSDTSSRWTFDGATWGEDTTSAPVLTTVNKTADYTITTADNGKCLTNIGASADIVFTLPPAAPDLLYKVAVHAAHYIRLNADGSEEIAWAPDVDAYIRSNVPYTNLTVECHESGGPWVVSAIVGPWSLGS